MFKASPFSSVQRVSPQTIKVDCKRLFVGWYWKVISVTTSPFIWKRLLFLYHTWNTEFICRVIQKKYATGKPDQKDLSENLAATQGLAHMIAECAKLFEVSERFRSQYSQENMLSSTLPIKFHFSLGIKVYALEYFVVHLEGPLCDFLYNFLEHCYSIYQSLSQKVTVVKKNLPYIFVIWVVS